jgi:hypothetical protein
LNGLFWIGQGAGGARSAGAVLAVWLQFSGDQGAARIGPLEWFCHRLVEVVNGFQDGFPKAVRASEIPTLQKTADQDAEADFNLIEPARSRRA